MPYIEVIHPEAATGELRATYDSIGKGRGGVAAVHQVQSLHPRAMRAHLELYKAVMFGRASLSRVERERIGVVVSAANECSYCVRHHAEALRQLDDEEAHAGSVTFLRPGRTTLMAAGSSTTPSPRHRWQPASRSAARRGGRSCPAASSATGRTGSRSAEPASNGPSSGPIGRRSTGGGARGSAPRCASRAAR